MLEKAIVEFCSPTLAGLKTAGMFGYPICDVVGFIEQKGRNYKCAGLWESYGDETEMTKVFRKLKKCREIYGKLFSEGRSIMQLTVAV